MIASPRSRAGASRSCPRRLDGRARRDVEPSVANRTRPRVARLATSTGHGAWSTTSAETEPRTSDATEPWPREPTMARSAAYPRASSRMALAGRPRGPCLRPRRAEAEDAGRCQSARPRHRQPAMHRFPPKGPRSPPAHGVGNSIAVGSMTLTTRRVGSCGQPMAPTRATACAAPVEPSYASKMRISHLPTVGGHCEPARRAFGPAGLLWPAAGHERQVRARWRPSARRRDGY